MESKVDTIRVKKEPNDIWLDAGDDYNSNLMDSCTVKNFKTYTSYKLSENQAIVLQTKLDEKVLIDFECKGFKTELKPSSTLVFKTEHQNCRPIVKIENQIQTSETNENIFIDFQCKDMKSESTTTCKTEYQSYQGGGYYKKNQIIS
ncbi:uncharacterized protein LOC106655853 [Trichogramma pretiosum]|uniref:uncharacterized protein LOC106655853 n=1 Tax=Trichogramma pretiosum TaxID=7493 RepID=UPI0006C9A439|nr:uncharacterized protein LOC106655853 [Trichogramma pretiosum]XP_014231922.1 uncharacterized protein LOC106655853 [Trichogramma pretiosum]